MRQNLTCWVILSMLIGIASYATTREFGLRAIDLGLSGGELITWWWDWHGALEYISFGLSTLWLAVFVAAWITHRWGLVWLLIGAPLALPQARAALRELAFIAVTVLTGDFP